MPATPVLTVPARVLRGPLAVLVVLVLAASVLAALRPQAAGAASDDTARPWAGYRIPRTGHADGGWIGGHRIGDTPVFLTTPTRRPNRAGFGPGRTVGDLGGARGASRTRTARAAWILSKYGGYRDDAQAAAVDAAVLHLLVGGKWRITGRRGAARIRAAGDRATVRRFAEVMLRLSRRSAGEYRATVSAAGADVGGTVAATVTVADGRGVPAPGLPVTWTMPGAPEVRAVTGDDGRAVARFPAAAAGWHDLTATVGQVPEHRLHLRRPDKPRQATVAEGGVRRTLVVGARAPVRGPQSLTLRAASDTVLVGSPAAVTARVVGDGTSRTATATLHGPFDSASAAQCAGPAVGTVSTTVTGNGDYGLPPLRPGASGYFAWRVAVDGAPTSLPVAACGAVTKVKAVATVSVVALEPERPVGNVAHVRVGLSGLPRSPAVTVTTSLWGPYPTQQELAAQGCSGSLAHQVELKMNGDDTQDLGIYVDRTGWYAWQAEVPPGELREGSRSRCLALGTVMHVY